MLRDDNQTAIQAFQDLLIDTATARSNHTWSQYLIMGEKCTSLPCELLTFINLDSIALAVSPDLVRDNTLVLDGLDLSNATIKDFSYLSIHFDILFRNCNLSGCDLSGLSPGNDQLITFDNCDLSGSKLANLFVLIKDGRHDDGFGQIDIKRSKCIGAALSFSDRTYNKAYHNEVCFNDDDNASSYQRTCTRFTISYCDLSSATLTNVIINHDNGTFLEDCNLSNAVLDNVAFSEYPTTIASINENTSFDHTTIQSSYLSQVGLFRRNNENNILTYYQGCNFSDGLADTQSVVQSSILTGGTEAASTLTCLPLAAKFGIGISPFALCCLYYICCLVCIFREKNQSRRKEYEKIGDSLSVDARMQQP